MSFSERFDFITEFYTVEKTVELACSISGEEASIRIEAFSDEANGQYHTRVYRDGEKWTDFPWTNGDSADDVINRALSFLRDRGAGK